MVHSTAGVFEHELARGLAVHAFVRYAAWAPWALLQVRRDGFDPLARALALGVRASTIEVHWPDLWMLTRSRVRNARAIAKQAAQRLDSGVPAPARRPMKEGR